MYVKNKNYLMDYQAKCKEKANYQKILEHGVQRKKPTSCRREWNRLHPDK